MQAENVFYIKLSELTAEMHSHFDFVAGHCKNYITDSCDAPDLVVKTSREQIDAEKSADGRHLSDGYCEDVCLYRAIAEQLPYFDRTVFHGAVLEVDGRGYVFTAPSGTGKTTHIKLWLEYFSDKAKIINGDKPIISLADEGVRIYSTPWAGKEGLDRNSNALLDAIVLLKRSNENKISRIKPNEYFDELIRQFYIPRDSKAKIRMLDIVDRVLKTVPIYLLECNVSREAAELSYRTLTEK